MGKIDYEKNLQNAIKDARKQPGVPIARFAALDKVNASTLSWRLAGITRDYATAARDRQLFDIGEEKAIANYIGIMADAGFPLNHQLFKRNSAKYG